MKTRTINKAKVKVFEEDELVEKLGLSKEECDLILEYQIKFPELLQDDKSKIKSTKCLYEILGFDKTHYSRWVKRNIIDNKYFSENKDWWELAQWASSENNSKTKDYEISVELAKHLCMQGNSDKCKNIRDYFILMERTLRNYESWNVTRGLEKDGWNDMKEQIKQWCIRKAYDYMLDAFYIREANLLNQSLTGLKASEIKSHLGYSDNITRNHLQEEINKSINELQKLNISLLMADLDFEFRKGIIKTTCERKYPHLYINKISA